MKPSLWFVSMRGRARIVAVAALFFAGSCSGGPASTSGAVTGSGPASVLRRPLVGAAQPQAPLLPPSGTIYFGAFVNFQKTLPPFEQQTAEFEQAIDRKLAIHAEYYKWTQDFPAAPEVDDFRNGRIPVISWDCGATNYEIAQGKQDAVIINRAQVAKTYGHPFFLRWFWEMNLPYADENRQKCVDPKRDTNGVFNPTDYIAAWQHIHDIFVAQGATNVVWLWCPSGNVTIQPQPYYPGAADVDWVGFDHYDVTGDAGLVATMSDGYNAVVQFDQPILVGETGTPGDAGNQGTYLVTAPSLLQANFPQIRAWIYYDAYGHREDWRLIPAAGIAAARAAGATPYFSAYYKFK